MNKYLIGVKRYFCGEETFEVEAENKTEALHKAELNPVILSSGGNVDLKTLRVIKKINKK